jgi:hypothetical protein
VPFRTSRARDFLSTRGRALCDKALRGVGALVGEPQGEVEKRFARLLRGPRNVTSRARRYEKRRNAAITISPARFKRSVQTII